ncbi:hypothetical protein SynMVIR181_01715 [Synechococcus sp. MVIR-18-1]|nr:hypothetical protein SynMVIR181_01715 [Synechococcus sp. MVIR-18-1]
MENDAKLQQYKINFYIALCATSCLPPKLLNKPIFSLEKA